MALRHALLNTAPGALFLLGPGGEIQEGNPAAQILLGRSVAEVIHLEFSGVYLPDRPRSELTEHLADWTRPDRPPAPLLLPLRHADGREVLCELTGAPLPAEAGGGTTLHLRPVTPPPPNDEVLKDSQELLQTVLNSSNDMVCIKDVAGHYRMLSETAAALFDRPVEALLGQSVAELLPPDEAEREISADRRIIESGVAETIEEYHELGGLRHAFRTTRSPYRDHLGRIVGVIARSRDICAQKMAEDRSRFLLEAGAALAGSLDDERTFETIVRLLVPRVADWCALELLGTDRRLHRRAMQPHEELPGSLDLSHSELVSRVLGSGGAELINNLECAGTDRFVEGLRRAGLHTAIVIALGAGGDNQGLLVLGTRRRPHPYGPADLELAREFGRRASLALESARLYRESQETVQARDEFMSIAAHELRTPLTSLLLLLESLRREDERFGREVQRLDRALHQTTRLTRLIDQLLDMSRSVRGAIDLNCEPVDLTQLVAQVSERMREEARRAGSTIEIRATDPVLGQWDRLRLDQILTHLLSNAIKYGQGRPIRIEIGGTDDLARLAIRDEGIGIDPRRLAQIFERYERAVSFRHYGGLGLGLYITRTIVRAHGGTIRAESAPGAGATFHVELPR